MVFESRQAHKQFTGEIYRQMVSTRLAIFISMDVEKQFFLQQKFAMMILE
jgi:hypothetical protein